MQNNSFIIPFLAVLGLGIIYAVLFVAFWVWATNKGWASVRLLSICMGLIILSLGIILWLMTKENWLISGTFWVALIGSLSILLWPITAKDVVKKMKLKW